MAKKTFSSRVQLLWDTFGRLDKREGFVFRMQKEELIHKRHRGKLYRLYARSVWKTPAKRVVAELENQGHEVLISPVKDKRVNNGVRIDYGIWVRE